MESNKNNIGGNGQQQLRRSARIRKLNKLANEEKPTGGDQPEPEDCSSRKKNHKDDGNHLDLEVYKFLCKRTQNI
jgi:hypothetical protein